MAIKVKELAPPFPKDSPRTLGGKSVMEPISIDGHPGGRNSGSESSLSVTSASPVMGSNLVCTRGRLSRLPSHGYCQLGRLSLPGFKKNVFVKTSDRLVERSGTSKLSEEWKVVHRCLAVTKSNRTRARLVREVVAPSVLDLGLVNLPKIEDSCSPFGFLPDEDGCRFSRVLRKKAACVVSFLSKELGIKAERSLPPVIECLSLRDSVRSVFPSVLTEIAELSLKTVAKLEVSVCPKCEEKHEGKLDEWKEERFCPQDVDVDHLADFRRVFRRNIPENWNRRKYPYIPNGHATLGHTRRQGGNWNSEPFAAHCRPAMVISSGKPRVVTLFSEFNTRVLTPLHYSLYEGLRGRGWLLVGEPTNEEIGSLNGCDYVSFDYRSATDKIKTAYVQAAIDTLIECAVDLSDDEIRCLRVLGELRLTEDGPVASSGQPMGSVMSFPLLCLINKTVFDMALGDLLVQGKITFNEWTCHRCRINGDDLLAREPRREPLLRPLVRKHGAAVGLEVNESKTMVDERKGEINSSLFVDGVRVKKVNAGALFMRPDVNDVLGFAHQASVTERGFRRLVRKNAWILAKQEVKLPVPIPDRLRRLCLSDAKIRKALSSSPLRRREPTNNFFTLETRPADYVLTRDEEITAVNERVDRVRALAVELSQDRSRFRTTAEPGVRRPAAQLRWKKLAREEDTILSVLARANETKLKESLRECDLRECNYDTVTHVDIDYYDAKDYRVGRQGLEFPGSVSRIDSIVASIKEWKKSRGPQMRQESFGSIGGEFISRGPLG